MPEILDLQWAIRAAWRPGAQSVHAVGSNWANFWNFSMNLSDNISEICSFRKKFEKIDFLKNVVFFHLKGAYNLDGLRM